MTKEMLDAIRARCAAATPGPLRFVRTEKAPAVYGYSGINEVRANVARRAPASTHSPPTRCDRRREAASERFDD